MTHISSQLPALLEPRWQQLYGPNDDDPRQRHCGLYFIFEEQDPPFDCLGIPFFARVRPKLSDQNARRYYGYCGVVSGDAAVL